MGRFSFSFPQSSKVSTPVARPGGPYTTAVNLTLAVDGSRSTASKKAKITSYTWVWGDSTPNGTGSRSSHIYTAPGTYTITLTIVDSKGYSASATTTATVADVLTVICPSDVTVTTGQSTGVAVSLPAALTTGGVAPVNISYSPASGTFPVGTTLIGVTATDAVGQKTTCIFTVTVVFQPPPPPPPPPSPTVVSVTITGTPPLVGDTATYVATATMSDATTRDVTASTAWHSFDSTIAYWSSPGQLVGVSAGTVTLVAIPLDVPEQDFMVTINAPVGPPTLSVVCPSNISTVINSGSSAVVTWTTPSTIGGTPTVTVNSLPASGSSFPIGTTTVTVTATDSGSPQQVATCTFTVTVTLVIPPPTLTSVSLSGPTTGSVGQTLSYVATGHYSDGSTANLTSVATWNSSNTSVATVSSGQVSVLAAGTTGIKATVSGVVSPTITLTVSAPPTLPGTPSNPTPTSGVGGVSTTPTLQWTSSGAVSYTVKFGTSATPPQVATGLTTSQYAPAALVANTQYFWQIIATNTNGSTTGPVWSFTTAALPPPPPPPPPPSGVLLQSSNLKYLGGFLTPQQSDFDYSGNGLAYNPANNSLFIGTNFQYSCAEITIPTPLINADPSLLNVASYLQPPVDPSAGHLATDFGGNGLLGGYLVYNGNLYCSGYIYYDGSYVATKSHMKRPLNLTAAGATSFQPVWYNWGQRLGFVAGYMCTLSSDWQAALGVKALTGQSGIPIISRTSLGVAAFGFDPEQITGGAATVPALPLLYYSTGGDLGEHATMGEWAPGLGTAMTAASPANKFHMAMNVAGITAVANTNTLLFFLHTTLNGDWCYGNDTAVELTGGFNSAFPETQTRCVDPTSSDQGTHSQAFQYYVWAYNLTDLVAVKNGTKNPYDVVPYATWPIPDIPNANAFGRFSVTGQTYDPATNRIFVIQRFAYGEFSRRPIIHVFQVQ